MRVDLIGGLGTSGVDVDAVPGDVAENSDGQLGGSGVVGDEDGGLGIRVGPGCSWQGVSSKAVVDASVHASGDVVSDFSSLRELAAKRAPATRSRPSGSRKERSPPNEAPRGRAACHASTTRHFAPCLTLHS